MPKVQVSVQIQASPQVVWETLRDLGSHVDWMLDAEAIRFTSRQRSGPGTTFDCDTKIGPFRLTDRMEITEWRPSRAMGVRHSGVVTGTGRFTLVGRRRWGVGRNRGGTRVRWEERLRFPWWFGGPVGAFVAAPVLRAVWRTNLRNLKELVERGA
jgi:hypothetical protein